MRARPLVTVATLTVPGRKRFLDALGRSIRAWTMIPDEWLIDDGPETVGEKRQRCLERAKGDVIVQMDDDDWQHPDRLRKQYEAVVREPGSLFATRNFFVHDLRSGRTVRSKIWNASQGAPPAGGMAFSRVPALEVGFLPGSGTEREFCDAWEQKAYLHFQNRRCVVDMRDPSLYVLVRHTSNVSPDHWCLTEEDIRPEELAKTLGPTWEDGKNLGWWNAGDEGSDDHA